jgi:hypothetical protein
MLAALTVFSQLPACSSKPTETATVTISPAASPTCAAVPAFRPAVGVAYRVRVEDGKKVYQSAVTFRSAATGWEAVESDFAIEGSFAPGQFGDLTGASLAWRLDPDGKPLGKPVETGQAKPATLEFVSLFAFRFPLGAPPPACPGAEWTSTWERIEGARKNTARFRVVEVTGGVVRVQVDASSVSSVNRWDSKGEGDVALEDGISGEMRVHVQGPGAPAVNVFDRVLRVQRADRPR